MADSHRWSVSVAGAVVREDGKVLAIQRRDNGHWEPPGGLLEPGEPMRDGVIREVREETGLVVEPEHLSGVYQNLERDIVSLVFRCSVRSGELTRTDETVDFEWLAADQVEARLDPAYAARLLDALSSSLAETRTHDGTSLV